MTCYIAVFTKLKGLEKISQGLNDPQIVAQLEDDMKFFDLSSSVTQANILDRNLPSGGSKYCLLSIKELGSKDGHHHA